MRLDIYKYIVLVLCILNENIRLGKKLVLVEVIFIRFLLENF